MSILLRAITLHDLLTYRLGIGWGKTSFGSVLFALTAAPLADAFQIPKAERLAPDAWMARIGAFPLAYGPGTRWLYHTASDILGILLARVTGKPLDVVLCERIFEPLGMVDTSFVIPPEKRSRLAVLYGPAPEGGLSVLDHPQTTGWAESLDAVPNPGRAGKVILVTEIVHARGTEDGPAM